MAERWRRMWGTCTNCAISVVWEVSPDAESDATLDPDELDFFESPSCNRTITGGAEPRATWEGGVSVADRRAIEAKAFSEAVAAMRACWHSGVVFEDPVDPETAYSADVWLEVYARRRFSGVGSPEPEPTRGKLTERAARAMAPAFWEDVREGFVPNAPASFEDLPEHLQQKAVHFLSLLAEALEDAGMLREPGVAIEPRALEPEPTRGKLVVPAGVLTADQIAGLRAEFDTWADAPELVLEDEDGAPYPEEVQRAYRSWALGASAAVDSPHGPCALDVKEGWACVRGAHEDGPCALVPVSDEAVAEAAQAHERRNKTLHRFFGPKDV